MTKFLIPSNPALFKRWEDLSDELQRSFKEKSYRERLDFWSKHCLEPMRYFRFPLRRRDPDYEVVGYITPENPEDRPLFYDFFKPYFMYQYSELCDLEKKKQELHNRLEIAPDKKLLLETEYGKISELKTVGRGTGQTYYEIGYDSTLEGRSFDFSRLDDFTQYWRLLEGETTFRYITYVKNLLDGVGSELESQIPFLQWIGSGSKGEMSELIYALCQSKRITYKNGDPVKQKDLLKIFEFIFNTNISDINTILRSRVSSWNRTNNRKELFLDELVDKIKDFKEG